MGERDRRDYDLNLTELRNKAEKIINEESDEIKSVEQEKSSKLKKSFELKDRLDLYSDKELSLKEARQIIHELKTYQLELEMQNEQLNKAYTEIKAARAHYYDLFDNAPVGYLTLDEKGIIKDANYTSRELLGQDKSKLLDKRFNTFIYPEDQDSYYFKRKKLFESGEKQRCELRIIGESGLPIWVQLEMKRVWDFELQDYKCRIVLVDISERKKAEKAIKSFYRYKNIAEKYESLCVFAGGLAHDFNNYLAILMSQISYSIRNVNEPDKVYEKLKDMENVIERAKDLTYQLSLYAKGEETVKKTSYIEKVVKESMDIALKETNVEGHLEVERELPKVYIDQGMIVQALYNILLNAVQAMGDKGNVWVEVSLESFEEEYVKISITDEGPGIPESYIDKIYDPFFTTKVEGGGLGLPTAFSIIKEHDGCIDVNSVRDKGTTFEIYLPVLHEKT